MKITYILEIPNYNVESFVAVKNRQSIHSHEEDKKRNSVINYAIKSQESTCTLMLNHYAQKDL